MNKGNKNTKKIIKGALMFATWAELYRKEILEQFETDLDKDKNKKKIISSHAESLIEDLNNEELSSKLIETFKESVRTEFNKPVLFKILIAITELAAVTGASYSLKYWDKLPSEIKIPLLAYIVGVIFSLAISKAFKS